ncbi:MAG: Lipopolysaccharide export system ATP-binding protein LptB [Alphaproteobacteria bacterium MarineAlpha9_Bin4]|nr:ABC transporter ATP-binding protein [Pelagibacterales bacterium]PPR26830.1 MAG: Lipopolysaccharide export system ATP-binding protein LptB [Alphaproteobacteria bacterium MarineAlpha9_Bin4]|tara:strand:- start:6620 stop:7384 length:765 start_codon:yes stop_codon:yes gene_type:complete
MLELKNISVQFGGIKALTDVSFKVENKTLFSIIGPNGAGKTTLLNIISGRYKPTLGKLYYEGNNLTSLHPNKRASLGIGRTFQNLALFDHMTVLENIFVGRHHLLKNNFIKGAFYWLLGGQKEEVNNRIEAEKILDFLEISDIRKSIAGTLSYGLRKRVELARAIAINPKLILLDEPMAGMNQEEKEDMARFIIDLNREWNITVIMIEHDMGVVMDISEKIIVLDFGKKIAEGVPKDIINNSRVQQAYLGDDKI